MTETVRLRAKGTFKSQYGMVRRGEIFWSEPGYAKLMVQKGNAEYEPSDREVRPERTQVIKEALSGKDPLPESLPDPVPQTQGEQPTNGQEIPASASPRGRRSRRKM
jgi:hypothetical protein